MNRASLSALLARWEDALRHGQDLSARALCPEQPHLHEPLQHAIDALRAVAAATVTLPHVPPLPEEPADRGPPGYEILCELGRGGMGVVYKARQVGLQRLCALKMILSGGHASEADLARFRTEAEAIARLQHPNIVAVYEVGSHQGKPFFSLELCSGGSLDRKLSGTPLEPHEAARLVQTLASAMQAAHQSQVIHRDLKPANVLLAADGTPKVTDFGLARKLDEASQTQTGAVMGTPSYMAPEQAEGQKEIGPRADVYALGAILYDCLTGRPPFRAATTLETIWQVIRVEPVPPRQLNAQVPRDLETICLKCLHKDPSRRYGSAAELASDLGRFQSGEPIQARPVGAVERAVKWVHRHAVVSALAGTMFLSLVGGTVASSFFAYVARVEASAARNAEREAEDRAGDEAEARALAQKEKRRAEEHLRRVEGFLYAGKLSLAQAAFAEDNVAVAVHHLNECHWDRRGWEHRHLWTRFHARQNFRGHSDTVFSVAWSPDGKRTLTGSADNTARVWDAETAQVLLTLRHAALVLGVAWSPDGKRIVTIGQDTAKVWNAQDGQRMLTLQDPDTFTAAAWSPDGKRLLTASRDKVATVWDAATGRKSLSLHGHTEVVTSVAFCPDGKRIVTGSQDKTAKVWDVQTGRTLLTLEHTDLVRSVAWSPDGRRILTGGWDMRATVWDAQRGQATLTVKGHTNYVNHVAWSPDGQRIVTGSEDHTARVFDAEKGNEVHFLKGYTGPISSVAFSPDGRRLLLGCHDGTAKVWNADRGHGELTLEGHSGPVYSVAFRPDGQRIVTGSGDHRVRVWDAALGLPLLSLVGHTAFVTSVTLNRAGTRILSGSWDKTAKVWDAEKGQSILTLKGHTDHVSCAVFSPDEKRILTCSEDRTVKVWDAQTGRELLSLPAYTEAMTNAAWSPDGQRILLCSENNQATVWDAQKGNKLLTLTGHTGPVFCVAFRSDGKRIVTGSKDKTAKVWDALDGEEIHSLEGHTAGVGRVAISPDGKRILTGAQGGVKVWDAEKGQEVFTLKHPGSAVSLAFSPDGKRIITGGMDHTARVWEAVKAQETVLLHGHTRPVARVAFSRDGKRLFAWDDRKKLLVWSTEDGQRTEPLDPPTAPTAGPVRSPDGFLRAEPRGNAVAVLDLRLVDAKANHWPLADATEQQRYHREQARRAELHGRHFAAAFHLGRLLLLQPDDTDLKRRRAAALREHHGKGASCLPVPPG